LAIKNAPEELIYTLLRHGSDPNHEDRRNWTPLFVAAADGRDTIISVLVNNGGNVDARNKFYQTPLMAACKAGNAATVKELLLAGASLDAKDRSRANAFTIARDKRQDE
ncbi:ankyrin repeat domain-containing protein, partial [Salmonella sp. s54836]|uniref:ankyrin repeat domain-containing protein n=1 Tax=Salmonella sp. s54836 TaxID=3159673 RepID=UPI0039806830